MKHLNRTTLIALSLMLMACSKDDEAPKNQAPGAFDLLTVTDDALEVVRKPSFSWTSAKDPEGDAVTYDLYLDTDSGAHTKRASDLTGTTYGTTSELELNTTYHWKVVAKDDQGGTTSSETRSFKTIKELPNNPPEDFALTTVADNSTDVSLAPSFGWETAIDPEGDKVTYAFYLDTEMDPATQLGTALEGPNFTLDAALEPNTLYFWKVIASDDQGNSVESAIFSFTTGNGFDGTENSVSDFYTPEHLAALDSLGITLNFGGNPPDLEGSYVFSPVILENSTVPGDIIGARFQDYLATISNQNNADLTLDFAGQQGVQQDNGEGSFVSGDGSSFTIYLKTTTLIGSFPAESTITISGKVVADGFEDVQLAFLMLDNNGNVQGVYIGNNTGRLAIDSDGFSPRQNTAGSKINYRDSRLPGLASAVKKR